MVHYTFILQCISLFILYQTGKIVGKRGLKRFTKTGCVFQDDTEVDDIDLVILATGFNPNLDFIEVPGIKGKISDIGFSKKKLLMFNCLIIWCFWLEINLVLR